MFTKEAADDIRANLKREGITSRQVSVKTDYFSGGSAIRVLVKDTRVSLGLVKTIAERHERIDRCERSGEILSGCNRYIECSYTEEARDEIVSWHLPFVKEAMLAIGDDINTYYPIYPKGGEDFQICKCENGYAPFRLWSERYDMHEACWNAEAIAYHIAMIVNYPDR